MNEFPENLIADAGVATSATAGNWIINVEKEIPWVENRVCRLAQPIVHSIMCPARIGDNNKVPDAGQSRACCRSSV